MEIAKEYSSGGVIYRETENGDKEILLIRVRQKKFELPKGHIEDGENEPQAALRECREEVGIISNLEVKNKIGDISYTFESEDKIIKKNVTYYSIICLSEFSYVKPRNTREIKWISEKELPTTLLINEELRPIIHKCFSQNK